MAGCIPQDPAALRRTLPAGADIVPSPALCRRAMASDNARVVAFAQAQCAAENQTRLRTARQNYDRVRASYAGGGGGR